MQQEPAKRNGILLIIIRNKRQNVMSTAKTISDNKTQHSKGMIIEKIVLRKPILTTNVLSFLL